MRALVQTYYANLYGFVGNDEALPLMLHNRLHVALLSGRYEEASELIKTEREDILIEYFENYKDLSPRSDKSGLHIIAGLKDKQQAVRLCRELIDNVTDPENRERLLNATVVEHVACNKWTVRARVAAIHIATCSGNAEVVRLLCEDYGVDVNCNTSETFDRQPLKGITPLHWAAINGHLGIAKLLLNNNDNAKASRTDTGDTPLHFAAGYGHTEAVKLLLDHNADVNAKCTDDGGTPLYIAAFSGHTEAVKLLLDHNADVNAKRTDTGVTPLYTAAYLSLIHI